MTFLPTEPFDYLADGHVDIWFRRRDDFNAFDKREFFSALDTAGYTYDVVRKRDAEVRIRNREDVVLDNPDVQGMVQFTKYGAKVTVNLRDRLYPQFRASNQFLIHHEMGHVFGLAHRFDDPISGTVMQYPTFSEITTGKAALRFTNSDLNNIRNFKNAILNDTQLIVGDDPITGTHSCGPWCCHNAFS